MPRTREPMRRRSRVAAGLAPTLLFLLLATLGPVASAGHWTLYHSGLDGSVARTTEDDGETVRATGNALDGRGNQVTPPGHGIGDGGLFLDTRIGGRLGGSRVLSSTQDTGFDVFADAFTQPALGRGNVILPGEVRASTWYGYWNDLDQDGVIRDIQDQACAGGCPLDEFRWRGAATDENIVMRHFMLPATTQGVLVGPSRDGSTLKAFMEDRTDPSNAEQGWIMRGNQVPMALDGSLLVTIQSITIAGAKLAPGTFHEIDLTDPDALTDVDRYQALSAEGEALYTTSARGAVLIADDARGGAVPDLAPVFDVLDVAITPVVVVENMVGQAKSDLLIPPVAREPNHAEDDFEERAQFGGVGDIAGSGNHYPGYAAGQGRHFFHDAYPTERHCVGAYAAVPGTAIETRQTFQCRYETVDPRGAEAGHSRGTGWWLTFTGLAALWEDTNGDGYVGTMCDPAGTEWDAATNTCRNAASKPPYRGGESVDVCIALQGSATAVTVTPVGADWPLAVFVPDHETPSRGVYGDGVRVLQGREPAIVRWGDTCPLTSRDAILFPEGGSTVPLRVESTLVLDGYHDPEIGVDVGAEAVRDVDVIMPML